MTQVSKQFNTTIDLDTPIEMGDTTLDKISLRKPTSGELRGINLVDAMQMDVATIQKLTPRIVQPTLTEDQVKSLDPADTFQIGVAITNFLLPKGMK